MTAAPWDADIEKILADLNATGVDLRVDLSPTILRDAMVSAWEHGYTTGMADSAKIDKLAADEAHQRGLVWNPMKMNYDPAPE